MPHSWTDVTRQLIRAALTEDLGAAGDVTGALLDPNEQVAADVVARQVGVICGLAIAPDICSAFKEHFEQSVRFDVLPRRDPVGDGDAVVPGQAVASLRGVRPAVLAVERTLLNFLGRMSGVATLTRRFVDAAGAVAPGIQIMDTRKTIPGWRELDKYAVARGGGTNHRRGLYDAILIKDNHLAGVPTERLASRLFEMLNAAAELPARPAFVEVEVDDADQLEQVFRVVGIDVVLLDNFTPAALRAAVERRDALGLRGRVALEASGGISLDTIAAVAASGVDRISVGALTHSAPSFDLALDFRTAE